mmetsp:Transcript_21635/g.48727  ORF Transcript_21635/g.48727 Transcript_21635/m.48727 type:complete len:80 (-) Transcript_21635:404-643(-)
MQRLPCSHRDIFPLHTPPLANLHCMRIMHGIMALLGSPIYPPALSIWGEVRHPRGAATKRSCDLHAEAGCVHAAEVVYS